MCVGGIGRQSSQVAALRVLAQLVVHPHHELALEFVRVRGEFVLLYVLSQSPSPDQQGVKVCACGIEGESCCVRTICCIVASCCVLLRAEYMLSCCVLLRAEYMLSVSQSV